MGDAGVHQKNYNFFKPGLQCNSLSAAHVRILVSVLSNSWNHKVRRCRIHFLTKTYGHLDENDNLAHFQLKLKVYILKDAVATNTWLFCDIWKICYQVDLSADCRIMKNKKECRCVDIACSLKHYRFQHSDTSSHYFSSAAILVATEICICLLCRTKSKGFISGLSYWVHALTVLRKRWTNASPQYLKMLWNKHANACYETNVLWNYELWVLQNVCYETSYEMLWNKQANEFTLDTSNQFSAILFHSRHT